MMTSSPSNARHLFARLWRTSSLALIAGTFVLTTFVTGCGQQSTTVSNGNLAKAPSVDKAASKLDFGYPSKPPSLKHGKEVFANNCASCHAPGFFQQKKVQKDFLYATPIDLYLMLTTGKAPSLKEETATHKNLQLAGSHPDFARTLTRDERWAAVFYARHLAGASDITHKATNNDPDIAAIYGGNCAVCHGKKGNANGPLHTGHPSNHDLKGGNVHHGLFYPAPARFTQYDRVFNRTDAQWFKYLVEGIYPSGMPAWLGNVDKDKNFVYDETLLWMLVKHLRSLAMVNDLPEGSAIPSGLVPGKDLEPPTNPKIPPVNKVVKFDYQGEHHNGYYTVGESRMPLLNPDANQAHH